MNRPCRKRYGTPGRQTGAALLVVALLFILGISSLLLNRLADRQVRLRNEQQTHRALAEAKEALIGYAVTYPDTYPQFGPGYLPCPDADNDGTPDPPCGPDAQGRLPWRSLGLQDLRDGDGERPWYALSDNFRNNPKLSGPLNSETPGQLTVNASGDVVAVLVAPGPPLEGQGGRPGNTIADYLEGENADGDGVFSTGAISNTFNDVVLPITRAELMAAVQKRVVAEVSAVLTTYQRTYGAYPWLSPFGDPAVAAPMASATLDYALVFQNVSVGGQPFKTVWVLRDLNTNFTGVDVMPQTMLGSPRYRIRNRQDNSRSRVTWATGNYLVVGLDRGVVEGGVQNDFNVGDNLDVYYQRRGQATAGSTGNTLVDSGQTFLLSNAEVQAGDVVRNLTDGSVGAVTTVDGDAQLTVSGLYRNDGTAGDFTGGDDYEIRRFRFNGIPGVREGQLPIHGSQEEFNTGFSVDGWTLTGVGVATAAAAAPFTGWETGFYATHLLNLIPDSPSDLAVPVEYVNDQGGGTCLWVHPESVRCAGASGVLAHLNGTAGATGTNLVDAGRDFSEWEVDPGDVVARAPDLTGTATGGADDELRDAGASFTAQGILPGHLVLNLTDGSRGIVKTVASDTKLELYKLRLPDDSTGQFQAGDSYRIERNAIVDGVSGGTLNTVFGQFTTGDAYQVRVATRRITGLVTDGDNRKLKDSGTDFLALGVQVGDIVSNTGTGVRGVVERVKESGGESHELELKVESEPVFSTGDPYEIRAGHVATQRRYEFELNFAGNVTVPAPSAAGYRQRNVQLTNGVLPSQPVTPVLTLVDYPDATPLEVLEGVADSDASGNTLQDDNGDFVASGVAAGDIIVNVNDGSAGTVTSVVDGDTLQATLSGGSNNDFRPVDLYRIYRGALRLALLKVTGTNASSLSVSGIQYDLRASLAGKADAASSGNTLVDAGVDFTAAGVRAGDPIENLSDGSSGTVTAVVNATTLTASLSGGAQNDFDETETYRIPYDLPAWFTANDWHKLIYVAAAAPLVAGNGLTGAAGVGSSGNTLLDTGADFTAAGVAVGDVIENLDDGSIGVVTAIVNATTLTATLGGGVQNDFDSGEAYRIRSCIPGADCLTLQGGRVPENIRRTLVIAAGPVLGSQTRPSQQRTSYFEGENADTLGDDVFQEGRRTSIFNDTVRAAP